jgi:hypothetical protein
MFLGGADRHSLSDCAEVALLPLRFDVALSFVRAAFRCLSIGIFSHDQYLEALTSTV